MERYNVKVKKTPHNKEYAKLPNWSLEIKIIVGIKCIV
jgi:hypothetical protein